MCRSSGGCLLRVRVVGWARSHFSIVYLFFLSLFQVGSWGASTATSSSTLGILGTRLRSYARGKFFTLFHWQLPKVSSGSLTAFDKCIVKLSTKAKLPERCGVTRPCTVFFATFLRINCAWRILRVQKNTTEKSRGFGHWTCAFWSPPLRTFHPPRSVTALCIFPQALATLIFWHKKGTWSKSGVFLVSFCRHGKRTSSTFLLLPFFAVLVSQFRNAPLLYCAPHNPKLFFFCACGESRQVMECNELFFFFFSLSFLLLRQSSSPDRRYGRVGNPPKKKKKKLHVPGLWTESALVSSSDCNGKTEGEKGGVGTGWATFLAPLAQSNPDTVGPTLSHFFF